MFALTSPAVDHADLLDEIDELVCVTDAGGRITYVNRAWRTTFGYTLEEAAARAPADFVTAEHQTAYREAGRRVMAGGVVDGFEAVLLTRDGGRVVAHGRARPVYVTAADGAPQFAGTYAVYRDVTAARHADAVRDRLVATLEASPDYVSVGTRDGALVFVNRSGRDLLGIPADRPLDGMCLFDLRPPDEAERLRREILPAVLVEGRWRGESVLRALDGTLVPVALTVVAHPSVRDDDPVPYFVSSIARDLRPERAAVAALRASEARYRSVVGALDEGVVVTEADGVGGGMVAACNVSAESILGLPPGTLASRGEFWSMWSEVVDADGLPFAPDALPTPRTLRTGEPVSGLVFGVRPPDGALRWIRASSRGLFREGARPGALPYAVVTTFADITAERAAAEEISELATAVDMSPDGLSVSAPDGTVRYANGAYAALHGYEPGALVGQSWRTLYEADEVERLDEIVYVALAERGTWRGEAVGRRRDGTHFAEELLLTRLPSGALVTAVRDISELKAHEAALRELSQRDELTGLLNRRGFFAHAERALAQAARGGTPCLLLYGDLDRFKAINDTRGHAAGDAALCAVARALREVFRPGDVLGRLGGDEFVVVTEGGMERAMALRGRLAEAITRAAGDAAVLGGADVAMSVGVAAFRPEVPGVGGGDLLLNMLLREADGQLYAMKAARRGAQAA